ncbi:MAG: glycoside hydrolase family 3 protein [Parvicellaceae bacterium]
MVLLKNENSLLPIPLNKKIGLIGPLADDSDAPIGNWRARANANSAISLLDGLNQAFGASNVAFEQGCKLSIGENNFHEELKINESDTSGFMDAIDLAKRCDIVVMALGETAYMSGEGRSRSKIGLPGLQLKLLKEVFKVNKNVCTSINEWKTFNYTLGGSKHTGYFRSMAWRIKGWCSHC